MGLRWASLAAAAVLALTGCGSDGGSEGGPEPGGWPTSSAVLDPTGLVWAVGSTVHLGDGSTVDVGAPIRTYVVGASGVLFSSTDDDSGPSYGGYLESWPLYFSDGSGDPRQVAEAAATLRTSPDGRYLAYLDLASGPKDDFGTPQAQAVVVDLTSGEEVARTSTAMGETDSDDLTDLYSESSIGVASVTDETAYVDGAGEEIAIDLASGDVGQSDRTGGTRLPPSGDRRSPDGKWRIADSDVYGDGRPHDRLVGPGGRTLDPRSDADLLDLRWWVDDTTVAGIAVDGAVEDGAYTPGSSATLVTCVVPSGACTEVDGTTDQDVVIPEGTVEDSTLMLGPR